MVSVSDREAFDNNLIKTIRRIDYLQYREEIELLPTEYARKLATYLIVETAKYGANYFFQPWISGDECGGVRLVWTRLSIYAQIRLIIPPNSSQRVRLYREIEGTGAMIFDVSGKILAQHLEWICEDDYQRREKLGDIIKARSVLS